MDLLDHVSTIRIKVSLSISILFRCLIVIIHLSRGSSISSPCDRCICLGSWCFLATTTTSSSCRSLSRSRLLSCTNWLLSLNLRLLRSLCHDLLAYRSWLICILYMALWHWSGIRLIMLRLSKDYKSSISGLIIILRIIIHIQIQKLI